MVRNRVSQHLRLFSEMSGFAKTDAERPKSVEIVRAGNGADGLYFSEASRIITF